MSIIYSRPTTIAIEENTQQTRESNCQEASQGQAFEHAHVATPCHIDPLETLKEVRFPHTSTVIVRVAEIIAFFPGVISAHLLDVWRKS
jgi:hypothetical protein